MCLLTLTTRQPDGSSEAFKWTLHPVPMPPDAHAGGPSESQSLKITAQRLSIHAGSRMRSPRPSSGRSFFATHLSQLLVNVCVRFGSHDCHGPNRAVTSFPFVTGDAATAIMKDVFHLLSRAGPHRWGSSFSMKSIAWFIASWSVSNPSLRNSLSKATAKE